MEESKQLNKSEIENETLQLQQEINRLYIYEYCDTYELDRFLCYFPNRAAEIEKCFYEVGEKKFLAPGKKVQLQNIIMEELCSLFEPYIKKGFKVKQLDGGLYHTYNEQCLICLSTPENNKNIGISIGEQSKLVFTNGEWQYDIDKCKGNETTLRLTPVSGIQINHYNDKCNNFHNEIKIFDYNINYTLIIHPNTKTIQLTNANEKIKHKTFDNQCDEIFNDKDEIINFFSTLSFAETEQVLQVLNENLKDTLKNKDYNNINIETVLKEIKNTIEKNRKEEKKEEEKKEENKEEENKEEEKENKNSNNGKKENNNNIDENINGNEENKDKNSNISSKNIDLNNHFEESKSKDEDSKEEEENNEHNNENNKSKDEYNKEKENKNSDISNSFEASENKEEENENSNNQENKNNSSFNNNNSNSFNGQNNENNIEENNKNTKKVLNEIKNTIEKNREEEKKEEGKKDEEKKEKENSISDIKENNKDDKSETKKNDYVFNNKFDENNNINDYIAPKIKIKEKGETPCNRCITCLKQCWPLSEKGK